MKSLYDQLSEVEMIAVASLIGFCDAPAGFKNVLRDIPAFKDSFTIGDAARAYLAQVAAMIG